MNGETIALGKNALETLAARYPQLYVAPAEGAEETNRRAAGRGIRPDPATLDHFLGSERDELRIIDTPAGPVEVLFLERRQDFETFLQAVGHRSNPTPIAPTIGAMTYRGLPDWGKVRDARESYLAGGGTDWGAEFARLAKEPGAFRGELIIISAGPYSNIAAADTPYDEDSWLNVSREIRLHHECAHVVCRRLLPDDILPVWDEVTADVVGLLCACDTYDTMLADRFLGISKEGYVGGRLIEYLDDEQKNRVDEIAREVSAATASIATLARDREANTDPFSFLLDLKRNPLVEY